MRLSLFLLCVALACSSAKESERSAAGKDAAAASSTKDGSMTATSDTAPVTAISGMSGASTAPMAAPTGTTPAPAGRPAAAPAGGASQGAPAGAAAPLTASEAAARYAQAQHGGGSDSQPAPAGSAASAEDNSCDTDADCGFTRVAPGACCPMLCAPRVVSKKQADALQRHVGSCRRGQLCPEPLCRPPLGSLLPTCHEHRCVGKPTRSPSSDD